MGLFNENMVQVSKINKIKVIKEKHGDKTEYILDCNRLKNSINLFRKIILELSINSSAWLIIDTSITYTKDREKVDFNVSNILEFLEEKNIPYEKQGKMVVSSNSIMGIPLRGKNGDKIERFDIGIEVTPEVLDIINYFFENFCIFFYISNRVAEFGEILNVHNNKILYPENESYSFEKEVPMDWYQGFIYADGFYKRMRIAPENEIGTTINELLINYKE